MKVPHTAALDDVDDVREFEHLEAAVYPRTFDVEDELLAIDERQSSRCSGRDSTDTDGIPTQTNL